MKVTNLHFKRSQMKIYEFTFKSVDTAVIFYTQEKLRGIQCIRLNLLHIQHNQFSFNSLFFRLV